MPGSFDLSPSPPGVATTAMPIVVALYQPGSGDDDEGGSPYTILPNVYCLRIDYREGPEPPVARFQYLMDDLLASSMGWPSQFEQLWPIDVQGNYVVQNDDRLCVLTQAPPATPDADPQTVVLFDGFAQIPQVDLSAQQQQVTFVALGAAVRLWDDPILGRTQRDADQTGTTDGSADIFVDLPCRFNPSDSSIGNYGGYIGNSVGTSDFTSIDSVGSYPVFIEPYVVEDHVSNVNYWYVSDAISYFIAIEPSPTDAGGNPYVMYPTIASLADILGNYSPPDDGSGTLSSGDATMTNVLIRDYDASNKAVPDAMAELLRYCGFVMNFATTADENGNPQTSLKMTRRDALAAAAPKPLYLAAEGAATLDLTANNVTSFHLARDCNQVVNSWDMETANKQFEITVYLAPGFQPNSGDDSATNVKNWYETNLVNATEGQRRMYRWYVADECGDGHWNAIDSTWVTDAHLDFTDVFPDDPDTGDRLWVARYRPGSKTLISKDAAGEPLKAVLELCTNSLSGDPSVLSSPDALTWTTVSKGWKLLDDRLGIEVTAPDPSVWHTAQSVSAGGAKAAVPTINGVTWLISPNTSANQSVLLRLTTVVDADIRINCQAPKRVASPTQFTRRRSADGKDHFQYCVISTNSKYYSTQVDNMGNPGDGTNPLIMRDDTQAALTHAEQLRSAHEFPTLAGSATLPFITDYYQIGDRVNIIQGRNASFQINVGVDQGETPCYPWITAFAWDFQGDKQQTIVQFSDRRAEPQGV